jgi:hypothetical protein
MDKKLNTTTTFCFEDGTSCEMTLYFYALYQLRNKNKALYDKYNRIMANMSKGNYEELDQLTILYIAYLCADPAEPMTEEEFIFKCGCDRKALGKAFRELTTAKKRVGSNNPS